MYMLTAKKCQINILSEGIQGTVLIRDINNNTYYTQYGLLQNSNAQSISFVLDAESNGK